MPKAGLVDLARWCKELCKICIRWHKPTIQTNKRTTKFTKNQILTATGNLLNKGFSIHDFEKPFFFQELATWLFRFNHWQFFITDTGETRNLTLDKCNCKVEKHNYKKETAYCKSGRHCNPSPTHLHSHLLCHNTQTNAAKKESAKPSHRVHHQTRQQTSKIIRNANPDPRHRFGQTDATHGL